jgi:hemerythrin
MDSVVVLVMLMFGQGAKTAFQSMAVSNQQTIQATNEVKQGIDRIATWIEKHRKDEEAMISQAELLRRQLGKVKP